MRPDQLIKEDQMRTRIKVITAGIIVAFTLLLPFAGSASATLYVSKKACEGAGGVAGTHCMNPGGKYHGLPILN